MNAYLLPLLIVSSEATYLLAAILRSAAHLQNITIIILALAKYIIFKGMK